MPGAGSVKQGADGSYQPTYDQYNAMKSKSASGQSWQQAGTRTIDGQQYTGFMKAAGNAAGDRGTGSQGPIRWVLTPPKPVVAKPVVKPVVKTAAVPVDPALRVTNRAAPYTGINRLRSGPGGGTYDNVMAKWGETYFNANKTQEDDALKKLGKGKYVGGPQTVATFGATV